MKTEFEDALAGRRREFASAFRGHVPDEPYSETLYVRPDISTMWKALYEQCLRKFGSETVFFHPGWTEGDSEQVRAELTHHESGLHLGCVALSAHSFSFDSFLKPLRSFSSGNLDTGLALLEEELLRGLPEIESRRDWVPEYPF